jgi:TonB family protein
MPAEAAWTVFVAVSVGLHAVAFVAAGNPSLSPDAGRCSPDDHFAIETAPALELDPSGPQAMTEVTRVSEVVPRSTHAQAYPAPPRRDAERRDSSPIHMPMTAAPMAAAQAKARVPEGTAAPAVPARFTMTVAQRADHDGESAPTVGRSLPVADPEKGSDAGPLPEDGVSSPALLTGTLAPPYPPPARAQELEADVVLSIVVTSTGAVADARIIKPAGFGFDEVALRAVRAARFAPAQRDGRRVAVRMRWTVSFRLR